MWAEFLVELKEEVLDTYWEDDTQVEILSMQQKDAKSFCEFSNKIEKLNAVLHDTPSHFDEKKLIEHMEVAACGDL